MFARKEDIRRIETLEMWIWRRMERISWTEKITKEEVLRRVGEERTMLATVVRKKRHQFIWRVGSGPGWLTRPYPPRSGPDPTR